MTNGRLEDRSEKISCRLNPLKDIHDCILSKSTLPSMAIVPTRHDVCWRKGALRWFAVAGVLHHE